MAAPQTQAAAAAIKPSNSTSNNRKKHNDKNKAKKKNKSNGDGAVVDDEIRRQQQQQEIQKSELAAAAEKHLPPLFLVLVVLVCSGTMLVFAVRDFFTTGRVIAGEYDESFLVSYIVFVCYVRVRRGCWLVTAAACGLWCVLACGADNNDKKGCLCRERPRVLLD